MKLFLDSIKMAISSLLSKKARSFLSMLGIVIGILTVSSLLSIALTVRNEIEGSINNLGSNLIDIVPGDVSGGNFANSFGTSTLTPADYNSITEVDGTENVSMHMALTGTVRAGNKTLPGAFISASSPNMIENYNLTVSQGNFYTQVDEQQRAKVAVLGSKAAQTLFGSSEAGVGKTVEIRSTEFKVVAVLATLEGGFSGIDTNNMVLIPIQTGWELVGTELVTEITLQANSIDKVNSVKKAVEETLLENHKGEKDFTVMTQEDILKTVGGILDIITAMLSAIAGISLLVGGIGIMNIMLVSVSERTREIGVRKAVGATQGAILLQFLIESAILTLVAGIVAVSLFSLVVSLIPKDSPIPISLEPSVLLLALGFSAVVGIIFGIIPAIGAARKNPIDALRYE